MLGPMEDPLRKTGQVVFLDHHPMGDADPRNVFCDPGSPSVGEVAWVVIESLGLELCPEAATCLYTAVAYDTNSFKYLRGRHETHLIAAELIRRGADTEAIYRNVFASNPPSKIELLGEVLRSIAFEAEGRIAWVRIEQDLLERVGASRDDLRDVITYLLEIGGVEIAITFKQRTDGTYKVSFRSKGRYPVGPLAASLGGGGHQFASGAYVPGDFDEVKAHVLALASATLRDS